MEKGIKILLVEDDANNARLLKDYLSYKGALVIHKENGLEAIKTIEEESFDLAIIDLRLPGENGFVVTEKIKKENIYTPVIITSAFSNQQNKILSLQAGADNFLSKPLNRSELMLLINIYTNRKEKFTEEVFNGLEDLNKMIERQTNRLNHGKKILNICLKLIINYNIDNYYLQLLNKAAILHDIGVLCNKTVDEKHPAIGANIIKSFINNKELYFLVKHHHDLPTQQNQPRNLQLAKCLHILQIAEKTEEIYKNNPQKFEEDLKKELIDYCLINTLKEIIK